MATEDRPPQDGDRFTRLNERIAEARRAGHRDLSLSGFKLMAIPDEVFELARLETLNLGGNMLDSVPRGLSRLRRLRHLNLSNNRVTSVDSLTTFGDLESLDLSLNGLTRLPPSIGRLSNLRHLVLRDNALHVLPSELGQLKMLEMLDASLNNIRTLPQELAALTRLTDLRLDHNPLADPLPALLDSGLRDLFIYLHSLADGRPQYEAKILLVGEGEVGKSSLISALVDEPFLEGRDSTHGIELTTLRFPHPELDVEMLLNAWDFGGQEVYRITHQFFFTPRALYLVVWKPRQGQDENAIDEWCRRIRLRVGSEAQILVVATHARDRAPELDYPELRNRYKDVLVGHHAVDNKDRMGIAELRSDIATYSARLPQMGEVVSASWQAAREELLGLPEAQIPYSRFTDICHRHGLVPDAAGALGRMLHRLGHIIHYDEDDGLRDVVVLQPEWLTKAISHVLEDEPTRAAGGVLEHARLAEIWGFGADYAYTETVHPYFLRLMEKFDVSYRIPESGKSLVGQLVPYERPALPWDWRPARQQYATMDDLGTLGAGDLYGGEATLALVCVLSEPAEGLMAWLTVRHHRFSAGLHWRRGAFLEHPAWGSQALLELIGDRTVTLSVRGPSPDAFFSILRDGLEYLIASRWEALSYDLLVPCPGAVLGERCPEHFKFRHLVRDRQDGISLVTCHECRGTFSISQLLTGFAQPSDPLQQGLDAISERLERVSTEMRSIKAITADSANEIRRVRRAISQEVADCPRLFLIVPAWSSALSARRWWSTTYRLTLWCEHPGHEHPVDQASYEMRLPKAWLERVGPYASLVVRTLKIITPIGGAAAGLVLDDKSAEGIKDEVDLMKALVDKLPESRKQRAGDGADGQLTSAEGAALRTFRRKLFDLDQGRHFGGLRRRQTPAGDFVWVCDEHDHEYDPGLPELSYVN